MTSQLVWTKSLFDKWRQLVNWCELRLLGSSLVSDHTAEILYKPHRHTDIHYLMHILCFMGWARMHQLMSPHLSCLFCFIQVNIPILVWWDLMWIIHNKYDSDSGQTDVNNMQTKKDLFICLSKPKWVSFRY